MTSPASRSRPPILDDPQHADDEDHFVTTGTSVDGGLLVVSHTDRGDLILIISAGGDPARAKGR